MFLHRNRTFALSHAAISLDFESPGWGASQYKFLTRRLFKMILEILAILFLMCCASVVARLIGRRRDVLFYLSKSNPG